MGAVRGENGVATLSEQRYASIRADILAGRARPGERLRLAALAERHGVSLSVVREALTRLSGPGEFTIYQQGQKALLTSRLVINAALRQPKVNELRLIAIPGGEYDVSATLYDSYGAQTVVRRSIVVVSPNSR